MIQTPKFHDALAKAKIAAKRNAKAFIRQAAHLLGKSPALRKFLIQTIKRFPAMERRMRASVIHFDATTTRRPGDLSPTAQAVLRRLLQHTHKKS